MSSNVINKTGKLSFAEYLEKDSAADVTNINITTIVCAACGKEVCENGMNKCNKCDLVAYCNAACKKKHRSKHKKKCDRRVAELYDEALFKEPSPHEDCPICFLPLPLCANQITFFPCCGKDICDGCVHAMREREKAKNCPFCRSTRVEAAAGTEKLMKKGNGNAIFMLAGLYSKGTMGMPQDWTKANELWQKAGELGHPKAYYKLAKSYYKGNGVEMDKMKAKHYLELAAMGGHAVARHHLGLFEEEEAGDVQRAFKHYIISANAGYDKSLSKVKSGFMQGYVAKDEYANILRSYQKITDEMKSDTRDQALARRNQMTGGRG